MFIKYKLVVRVAMDPHWWADPKGMGTEYSKVNTPKVPCPQVITIMASKAALMRFGKDALNRRAQNQ